MVSRNLWNVVGAVGLLFLAGCTGGSAPKVAPSSSAVPLVAPSGAADANTCGIEGFVGDESFLPIAGADVGIQGLNVETRTAQDGRFSFSFVQPGTQTIVVNALGYATQSRRQVCEPGERYDDLIFSLKELPKAGVPFDEKFQKNGMIGCTYGWLGQTPKDYCGNAKDGDGNYPLPPVNPEANRTLYFFYKPGLVTGAVYELQWTQSGFFSAPYLGMIHPNPTQQFGWAKSFCPGTAPVKNAPTTVQGRSRVCVRIESTNATSFLKTVGDKVAVRDFVKVQGADNFFDYATGPTNQQDQSSKLIYQQKIQIFVTLFYNGKEIPPGYSGFVDA